MRRHDAASVAQDLRVVPSLSGPVAEDPYYRKERKRSLTIGGVKIPMKIPMKKCPYTGLRLSRIMGRPAVLVGDHPAANNRGYVLRSRYVMERELGRYLNSDEHVHHKDGNPENDDIDNLEVVGRSEHMEIHWRDGTFRRKLDYNEIRALMKKGYGYKRIAKALGEPMYSVKSACRRIKRGRK